MNILFSVTNLSVGGAQMFVLNLANSLSLRANVRVFIYNHDPDYSNKKLYEYANSRVQIKSCYKSTFQKFVILKINGMIKRFNISFDIKKWHNLRVFERVIRSNKIDIVNSHMSASDFICSNCNLSSAKFLLTLHGEYELYFDSSPKFRESIKKVMELKPYIVYTANKNTHVITNFIKDLKLNTRKVYIGISPDSFDIINISRTDLGIQNDSFVIGMIGRGIPEKGWELAIDLFRDLKASIKGKVLYLILVADGSYVRELVKMKNIEGVILKQFTNDYQDYFSYYKLFDLFLLPSKFKAESVPTVIAESLYWNVPVVASNIGEVSSMISTEKGSAGAIVDINVQEKMKSDFLNKIREVVNDKELLNVYAANCKDAAKKFDIKEISKVYYEIFEELNV